MANLKLVIFTIFITVYSLNITAQNMDNESLEKILYVLSDSIQGKTGQWQFKIIVYLFVLLTRIIIECVLYRL